MSDGRRPQSKPWAWRLRGALLGLLFGFSGCAFHPQRTISDLCVDCQHLSVDAGTFILSTYTRNIPAPSSPVVHVYLEGDGHPWRRGRWPSANPSSRHLTALQLMMRDSRPSIYLNRPCYGLDQIPARCTSDLWTGGRYSKAIVQAMQNALDQLRNKFPGRYWLLIGHSGGGSLAMLIAQGRGDVVGVITLAANLDTDAWTSHFGYLPLEQSSNPALAPPLPANILRWHYAAESDNQVPASLVADAAQRDRNARFTILPGDHECCWREHWPRIPEEMAAQLETQFTGTK